jgi:NADH dehydrogenase (ubiquinone) Fe-S protein 3
MLNTKVWQNLISSVPQYVETIQFLKNGELVVQINKNAIIPFFLFIRDHSALQMKTLIDITAVDFPTSKSHRFEVVYNLLSTQYNARLRVKVCTSETESLQSIEKIYSSAGWFERETWDMFGIFFSNHSDLRRILTDYGFEGHPLKKDFPLSGYVEARFDEPEKRVVLEQIELTQDFRFFEYANPWSSSSK